MSIAMIAKLIRLEPIQLQCLPALFVLALLYWWAEALGFAKGVTMP